MRLTRIPSKITLHTLRDSTVLNVYISFHNTTPKISIRWTEWVISALIRESSLDPYLAKHACCHLTQRLEEEGMTPTKWNGITGSIGLGRS